VKKIYASQVSVGMYLSCDIYNDKGVLLWAAGSEVRTEQQVKKLVNEGFRSDLQEWVPANVSSRVLDEPESEDKVEVKKVYVYNTVLDALLEIQLPLNYIFDVFKADAFHKDKRNLTPQINSVVDVILDVCEKHPEESLATIQMYTQGKYTIMHAIAKSVLSCLMCHMLDVPEEKIKITVAAALTSNGAIIKLMETMCKQKVAMTTEQTLEYEGHPFNTLTLLTRAGVRDEELLDTVLMHHEFLDGSGFPRGLEADAIPQLARIVAIADTYVELFLPKQVMQQAMDPPTVIKRLYKKYRKRLDSAIIADIVKRYGIIPPGTFVRLKDGKVGVVIKSTDDNSKPLVTKVGDNTTKFYADFNLTLQYPIVEVLRPPSNIPKRLFKLWEGHSDEEIEKEEDSSRDS